MKTVLKCYLVNRRRVKAKVCICVLTDIFKLSTDLYIDTVLASCSVGFALCCLFGCMHSSKETKSRFSAGTGGTQSSQRLTCAQISDSGNKSEICIKKFRWRRLRGFVFHHIAVQQGSWCRECTIDPTLCPPKPSAKCPHHSVGGG